MMEHTKPEHVSSKALHEKRHNLPCVSLADGRSIRRRKPAKRSLDLSLNLPRHGCFICGVSLCTLISHRLATLEALHRISKTKNDPKPKVLKPDEHEHQHPTRQPCKAGKVNFDDAKRQLSAPRLQMRPARQLRGWPDPFTTFPIKMSSVTEVTIQQFDDFFTRQGRELRQGQKLLSFDSGHYSWLLPRAMQNGALFMSLIAMSATYAAVHGRMLDAPDAAVLATYSCAYQELQRQIDRERSEESQISESTIMAAIDLVMCCGIGFGDWKLALLHWTGVRALLPDPTRSLYSGALLGFINFIEHWLVLTAGFKPRNPNWPVLLRLEQPPQKVYGGDLHRLVEIPGLQGEVQVWKTIEVAENTCRATEILEQDSRENQRTPQKPTPLYFNYIRGVLAEQSALVYTDLAGSDTTGECIILTLSIFYLTILRMTPWRAPLLQLCAKLKRVMSNSGIVATCQRDSSPTGSAHACFPRSSFSQSMLSRLYIWMLFVCAHGARLCGDESTLDWIFCHLQEALTPFYCSLCDANAWQQNLLTHLEAFCWSRLFMKSHFTEICKELMVRSRASADTESLDECARTERSESVI